MRVRGGGGQSAELVELDGELSVEDVDEESDDDVSLDAGLLDVELPDVGEDELSSAGLDELPWSFL